MKADDGTTSSRLSYKHMLEPRRVRSCVERETDKKSLLSIINEALNEETA